MTTHTTARDTAFQQVSVVSNLFIHYHTRETLCPAQDINPEHGTYSCHPFHDIYEIAIVLISFLCASVTKVAIIKPGLK